MPHCSGRTPGSRTHTHCKKSLSHPTSTIEVEAFLARTAHVRVSALQASAQARVALSRTGQIVGRLALAAHLGSGTQLTGGRTCDAGPQAHREVVQALGAGGGIEAGLAVQAASSAAGASQVELVQTLSAGSGPRADFATRRAGRTGDAR